MSSLIFSITFWLHQIFSILIKFINFQMSDSEAVVEKRRGRPSKDKSEVNYPTLLNYILNVFVFIVYMQY